MDKGSVIRTALLVIALINQGLIYAGKSPLPFSDVDFTNFISYAFTVVTAAAAWWKNNYVGPKGKKQKAVLKGNNLA